MKTRVFIGLLVVSVLCVALVWGQTSTSEKSCCPSSGQKVAATCPSTAAAKLASADGKACSASKTQATACSSTATAKLASLTDKPSACCASKTQATACSSTATASLASLTAKPATSCASKTCSSTAAAKLASAKPGCPMQAAGIQLCDKQQAKVMAILAQARKDMLAVLTSEQKAKFAKYAKISDLSLMPVVFAQPASLTTSAAGCSQSCSSAKTVAQTSTSASGEKACCGACGGKATTVAEQTTCPIMKTPIKKSVFTVYQGKKVYFCCPGCEKAFTKNPEKYAKNLPQF